MNTEKEDRTTSADARVELEQDEPLLPRHGRPRNESYCATGYSWAKAPGCNMDIGRRFGNPASKEPKPLVTFKISQIPALVSSSAGEITVSQPHCSSREGRTPSPCSSGNILGELSEVERTTFAQDGRSSTVSNHAPERQACHRMEETAMFPTPELRSTQVKSTVESGDDLLFTINGNEKPSDKMEKQNREGSSIRQRIFRESSPIASTDLRHVGENEFPVLEPVSKGDLVRKSSAPLTHHPKTPRRLEIQRPIHTKQYLPPNQSIEATVRAATLTKSPKPDHVGKTPRLQPRKATRNPPVPSPEELMSLVMLRYRRERSSWETRSEELSDIKRAFNLQVEEIKMTHQAYEQVRSELLNLQQAHELQKTELIKYQNLGPTWKTKIQKLEDFIRGLGNDHHRLRDDVRLMHQEAQSLQEERRSLQESLKDAKASADQTQQKCQEISSESKYQLARLEDTIRVHEDRIERDRALIGAIHGRNDALVAELSSIASDRLHHLKTSNQASDDMIFKLAEIHEAVTNHVEVSPSTEDLKSPLNQCLQGLADLKSRPKVQLEDWQKLDAAINGIIDLTKASTCELQGFRDERLGIDRVLQRQIEALGQDLKAEQSLSYQLVAHKATQSALDEKLRTANLALVKSDQQVRDLQASLTEQGGQFSQAEEELSRLRACSVEYESLRKELASANVQVLSLTQHMNDLNIALENSTDLARMQDSMAADSIEELSSLRNIQQQNARRAMEWQQEKIAITEAVKLSYQSLKRQMLETTTASHQRLNEIHDGEVKMLNKRVAREASMVLELQKELTTRGAADTSQAEAISELRHQVGVFETTKEELEQALQTTEKHVEYFASELQSRDTEVVRLNDQLDQKERIAAETMASLELKVSEVETLQKRDENTASAKEIMESRIYQLETTEAKKTEEEQRQLELFSTACQTLRPDLPACSTMDESIALLIKALGNREAVPKTVISGLADEQASSFQELQASTSPRVLGSHQSPELPYTNAKACDDANERPVPEDLTSIFEGPPVNFIVEESQVEETISRSFRRLTSSRGRDDQSISRDDSGSRLQNTFEILSFSQIAADEKGCTSESEFGDTTLLFPSTPTFKCRQILAHEDDAKVAKAAIHGQESARFLRLESYVPETQSTAGKSRGKTPQAKPDSSSPSARPSMLKSQSHAKTARTFRPPKSSGIKHDSAHGAFAGPPKGILRDSRGTKRPHADSSNRRGGSLAKRRSSKNGIGRFEMKELGIPVGSSQSPSHGLTSAAQAQQAKKSLRRQSQEKKFADRFAQYGS